MKPASGKCVMYLAAASGFLSLCAGCYNPKADIDAFRPQAEKYVRDMEQVGKTVAAQPPLAQDTMTLPDAKRLNFTGAVEDGANAVLISLEELSDIGEGTKVYERFIGSGCVATTPGKRATALWA